MAGGRTSQASSSSVVDQAIAKASRKYGVPAATLEGIWQNESSKAYPNPYSNGLGYGGEFGTQITAPWGSASETKYTPEPPVQQQADTAASILARLLRDNGGDMAKALSAYSGGGYSSVPGGNAAGATTSGIAGGVLSPAGLPGAYGTNNRPGGSGGSSFWSSVENAAGDAVSTVEGAAGSLIKNAEDLITGPVAFLKAAVWLLNPATWLRAVETIIGMALIFGGIAVAVGADRAVKSAGGPAALAEMAAEA